jgi:hypothetical protein
VHHATSPVLGRIISNLERKDMNKKEVQQRVLQNGKPLDLDKFEWDEKAGVFSTTEGNLVLDFKEINNKAFKTSSYCTFKTGLGCTFDTGSYCIFDTGSYCTFKTGWNCTFDTGWNCIFDTGSYCTFKTGSHCTFDTGPDCVVVRRDIYEVIELEEGKPIKLNGAEVRGFTYTNNHKITIDGKDIEISEES